MRKALQGRLQAWLVTGSTTRQTIAIVVLCLIVGIAGGALFAFLGPLLATAFVVALAGGLLMLRSVQFTFFALVTLICLLPFASLPLPDIGFSPTLLDLVLAVLLFVGSPLGSPIVIFMVLACVSFVFGLSFASITTNLLRQFAEFLLNMLLFFLVLNNVHSREQLEKLVTMLILAGLAAALIGLFLYILPHDLIIRLLSTLRIFRYPAGSAVLRFVEDNPDLPLRATSTSIDPNVLGGLLGIVAGVTAPQLVAPRPLPLLGRWWRRRGVNWLVLPILGVLVTCLLLTYSRSALAGLAVALLVLALLRYRRLLVLVLLAALLILFLPQTQWYVQHFVEMIRGQDLATQMRFGEYKDALILISRYPWVGVGFAGAPDIDTYIGVSSVYLLIAEEMGLIGLAVFLLINALAIRHLLHWLGRDTSDPRLEAPVLGLLTALLAALISGIGDHYFFNISFQHAVALYWLCLGLAVRATLLPSSQHDSSAAAEQ
jgi:O-antigen ligase